MALWPPEGRSGEDCPSKAEVLRDMAGLPEGEPVERYPGDLLQALENARYKWRVKSRLLFDGRIWEVYDTDPGWPFKTSFMTWREAYDAALRGSRGLQP